MSDKPETDEGHITVTATEARAGHQNKPILYVLIGSVVGAIVAVFVVFAVINP